MEIVDGSENKSCYDCSSLRVDGRQKIEDGGGNFVYFLG